MLSYIFIKYWGYLINGIIKYNYRQNSEFYYNTEYFNVQFKSG